MESLWQMVQLLLFFILELYLPANNVFPIDPVRWDGAHL